MEKNEETEGSHYIPCEENPKKRNRVKRTTSSLNTTLMAWRQFVKTCRTRGHKPKGLNPNLPPNEGGQSNWSTQSSTCPQAKRHSHASQNREKGTNLAPLKIEKSEGNLCTNQEKKLEDRREMKIKSPLKPKQRDEDIGASPKWGWTRIPPRQKGWGWSGMKHTCKIHHRKAILPKQTRTPPKPLALTVSSWELKRL